MAGTQLNVISSCARSPYFECTRNQALIYGECGGRLTPLSLGNDINDEYWMLRKSVGLFDVPERPVEITGVDSVRFLNRVFTRPNETLKVGRGTLGGAFRRAASRFTGRARRKPVDPARARRYGRGRRIDTVECVR